MCVGEERDQRLGVCGGEERDQRLGVCGGRRGINDWGCVWGRRGTNDWGSPCYTLPFLLALSSMGGVTRVLPTLVGSGRV